jgi:hypothetical protein
MDGTGNLWIFGGSGLDSAGVNNDLNDEPLAKFRI